MSLAIRKIESSLSVRKVESTLSIVEATPVDVVVIPDPELSASDITDSSFTVSFAPATTEKGFE